MKRVLLFLGLLAIGLGVLRYMQGHGIRGGDESGGGGPRDWVPKDGVNTPGLTPGGAMTLKQVLPEGELGQRPTRLVIEATDSGSRDDGATLYFSGVELRYLDPEVEGPAAQTERMIVRAKHALAARAGGPGSMKAQLDREIKLADVEITILDGAPIVPLSMRVPELVIDLEARTLTSADAVTLSGPGVEGDGVGLFVDDLSGVLRVESDTRLRLDGYRDGGMLRSAGPVELMRADANGGNGGDEEGDVGAIELRASGGASLTPLDEDGAEIESDGLRAESIVVRGRDESGGIVTIQTVDAHGDVRYATEGNELRGGRARVELDEDGEPEFARMTEQPVALLKVDPKALGFEIDAGSDAESDAHAGVVRVTSDVALTIRWEADGTHVAADGPATVRGEQAVLISDGDLTGVVLPDQAGATFECFEGVRLERDDAVLVTRALEATVTREDGEPVMHVVARGRPLVTGKTSDGDDVIVNAEGDLWFEQRGDLWSIPRAEKVALRVVGEDNLFARADLVEDFDPAASTLRALGNVQVESAQGTGRGSSLEVHDRERFTLRSTPETRVVFESPEGTAEADTVERNGDSITLRSRVEAHFRPHGGDEERAERFDALADELVIRRTITLDEDGEDVLARRFEIEALGVREARMRRPTEGLDLVCEKLEGFFAEELDELGATRARYSSFQATNVEDASVLRGAEVEVFARLVGSELGATRQERYLSDGTVAIAGEARARGAVAFDGTVAGAPFHGTAEEVKVDHEGTLVAHGTDERKVHVEGLLPSNQKPFSLDAATVVGTPDSFEATEPEVTVLQMQPGTPETPELPGEEAIDIRASARRMTATRERLELIDDVHVEGLTKEAAPWRLDAGFARFEGRVQGDGEIRTEDLNALVANRGVRLELPEREMIVTGEEVRAKRLSGIMRLDGVPSRVSSPSLKLEAEWFEIDINAGRVVGTGSGRLGGRPQEDSAQDDGFDDAWIDYRSMSTLNEPDSMIVILEEPRIHYDGPELRAFFPSMPTGKMTIGATFAVFWLDQRGLDELPDTLKSMKERAEQAQQEAADKKGKKQPKPGPWDQLREYGVLNEVYLEGPVEITLDGQPSASAAAVYLDVISGNGWLSDATFTITSDLVGRRVNKVTVHAKWLRQSDDSSYFADDATVSLCEFDDPHLLITTSDLRITPSTANSRHFDVRLRGNSIRMFDLFSLPLPSIDYSTDAKGRPIIASVKLGSSARFGSFVSAGIVRPAEGAGKALHGLLGRGKFNVDVDVDAQYNLDASWLGSRGVLLDLGFLAEAKGEYRWLTSIGGIPDRREDKGFIRVDEDDRDSLRLWARTHGRYWFERDHWLDVVGTTQTDAGVQSEFFESEFTRYEQTETYIRWRKANGNLFTDAGVVVQADDSFTGIDEVPTLNAYRGSAEILPLGPMSVRYGANASVEFLRRHESEGGYESPFGYPATFADGLGDRETWRFDTEHKLEAPIGLGFGGLRATPFALARFTAWTENVDEDDSPMRGFGQVGVRVSSAFWKPADGGGVHQLAPYVTARRDVLLKETGGDPVFFDEVESPLEGNFVDVGVRTRVALQGGSSLLDLDLRATHAAGTPAGTETGWVELGHFSRLTITPFGLPVELTHDGRYDLQSSDTLYSRIALGLRPTDRLAFEAAHFRGVDVDHEALFEAASIRGLYTWTEKWEFEGKQSFSLLDEGGKLGSAVVLRRYGHDLVFEIETSFRQGEGTSFGINVRPLFAFSRPDLGDGSF